MIYDLRMLKHPLVILIDFYNLIRDKAWVFDSTVDLERMKVAANHLIGKHDFAIFRNSGCQALTSIRNIFEIKITSREAIDSFSDLVI